MIWFLACAEPPDVTLHTVSRATLPAGAWADVSMDDDGACVRTDAGEVRCWRHDGNDVKPVAGGATAVVGGPTAGCGLSEGAARCWGSVETPKTPWPAVSMVLTNGVLCTRSETGDVACGGSGPLAAPPIDGGVLELSGGAGTVCARRESETVCWGEKPVRYPMARRGLALARRGSCWVRDDATLDCAVTMAGDVPEVDEVVAVTLGSNHLCATRTGGRVHCVARDSTAGVPPAEPMRDVTAHLWDTCGLRIADGSVSCWGPHYVSGVPLNGVISMSLTGNGGCALVRGGDVRCFGTLPEGSSQLVNGPFRGVSVEPGTACGLKADRTATCWGSVQLRGPDEPFERLAQVETGVGVRCGVLETGGVRCWGKAAEALGPAADGPWDSVSAGAGFVCAVGGGRIGCWGPRSGPPPDPGPWSAVSVGLDHACGLRSDGSVSCWGARFWRTPPIKFQKVAAGELLNCGLDLDGAIVCWGQGRGEPPAGRYVDLAVSTRVDSVLGTLVCARDGASNMDCAFM